MRLIFEIETAANRSTVGGHMLVNWLARAESGDVCYRGLVTVPLDADMDALVLEDLKTTMRNHA